ncbi:hypothetical protein AB0D65_25260 [Streptomyces griseoloalbus]|uniref:Secreted protein n=1 Tax=Streptomyces griseoloalbus TaxID=67303 RepID=A0ABV3EDA6_9ACTN
MKSLKAAAVLAGSLIAAGVAAPAFANSAGDPLPAAEGRVIPLKDTTVLDMPLQKPTDVLDTESKDSLLNTVKDAAASLQNVESAGSTATRQG